MLWLFIPELNVFVEVLHEKNLQTNTLYNFCIAVYLYMLYIYLAFGKSACRKRFADCTLKPGVSGLY